MQQDGLTLLPDHSDFASLQQQATLSAAAIVDGAQ